MIKLGQAFFFRRLKEIENEAIRRRKQQRKDERNRRIKQIREQHNMTIDEYLVYANQTLRRKRLELESYIQPLADGLIKVNRVTKILWTFTNCLFVVGGMIGAFTSKYVLDIIGRKKGILLDQT